MKPRKPGAQAMSRTARPAKAMERRKKEERETVSAFADRRGKITADGSRKADRGGTDAQRPPPGRQNQADKIPMNNGRTNRSTAFSAVTSGTQRSSTTAALIMPLTWNAAID